MNLVDVCYDLRCLSKSMSSVVATCHYLWRWNWAVDNSSKARLNKLPFKRALLVREELEKLVSLGSPKWNASLRISQKQVSSLTPAWGQPRDFQLFHTVHFVPYQRGQFPSQAERGYFSASLSSWPKKSLNRGGPDGSQPMKGQLQEFYPAWA